ncbi:Oligoribonuclease (modular protein) [Vibrio coralliirubri]|nr:Oligoribonuclease (modular protein) [Vibrio coralliirubri]
MIKGLSPFDYRFRRNLQIGAIHRVRTDDLNLGKVALYQLS